MPPATKITKEMILTCGYEPVKTNGIEGINARNLAKTQDKVFQLIYLSKYCEGHG